MRAVEADLHAPNPWPVALALAPFGMRLFCVHGIRPRLAPDAPHGVELICTCVRRAGENCLANVPGKHPMRRGWQQSATDVEIILRARAAMHPLVNVGVATGAASNLVIVDIDGDLGLQSFAEAERELGALPDTVRSRSGREGVGFHVWLRLRPGDPVPGNRSGSVLGSGVDVRGAGGLALIPGSRHKTGRRYTWIAAPDQVDIAPIPPAWLERLTGGPEPVRARGSGHPKARTLRAPPVQTESAVSWLIGDAPGHAGFHAPIYRRLCAYFAAQTDAPAEPMIEAIRAAILIAPKAPGRDVRRYLDAGYLAEQADNARRFVLSQNA